MLAEIVISALIAPIMMLIQSASVIGILSGRDSGWNAQRRDDGTLPWRRSAQALRPLHGVRARDGVRRL